MGSTGISSNMSDNTRITFNDYDVFDIERSQTTVGKTFSSRGALVEAIASMDNGRYDVLDNRGDNFAGTIFYTDAMASDGVGYELHYRANYTQVGKQNGIQIDSFKQYEEGEW